MFDSLPAAAPDEILELIGLYRDDPRPDKVDLGVGVYRDRSGATTVMGAVRTAEARLLAEQETKTYLGLAGDVGFNAAIARLALGEALDEARVRALQTPGGSGALRVLAELLALARPGATVWTSDPTWANHLPVMTAAGLRPSPYPYFDQATGGVRFEEMLGALRAARAGDAVLLHGCCHNPTGANLEPDEWRALGELLVERDLVPFVDIAYQGFGDGLDEDAFGLRHLASVVPEMVVAVSCSKNFAVYRDRVGAALLLARDRRQADTAFGQLKSLARQSYSMPPDHGAAAVRMVLEDEALRADWRGELDAMRTRMLTLRRGLADALRRHSNTDRFDFLAAHRGMFSRLGLAPEQVRRLREEHAVYMVGDSRINVAGLPDAGLDALAAAIVAVAKP